jgi:hypothetical protein
MADATVADGAGRGILGVARRLADAVLFPAAAAADLALRAAAALVVETGSRAAVRHGHPERLAREALFLLVFGSRPAIKAELLARLGAAGD